MLDRAECKCYSRISGGSCRPLDLAFVAFQAVIIIAQDERHTIDHAAWPAAHAVDMPAPTVGAYGFIRPPQPGPGQVFSTQRGTLASGPFILLHRRLFRPRSQFAPAVPGRAFLRRQVSQGLAVGFDSYQDFCTDRIV